MLHVLPFSLKLNKGSNNTLIIYYCYYCLNTRLAIFVWICQKVCEICYVWKEAESWFAITNNKWFNDNHSIWASFRHREKEVQFFLWFFVSFRSILKCNVKIENLSGGGLLENEKKKKKNKMEKKYEIMTCLLCTFSIL